MSCRHLCWLGVCLLSLAAVGCGGGDTVELTGNGASFPDPIYQRWFKDYGEKMNGDVQVDYTAVGSGTGVKNFLDKTVDFAASDAAMKREEIEQINKDRGVQLLPMTAGAIVLAHSVEGVKDLKLPRDVYVDILLGKITNWSDPRITEANPGERLPNEQINVITRSDSSGTTYVFTKHLCEVSKEFESKVGNHKQPEWPAGTKEKGNAGITAALKNRPNSIGYIEYGYAKHQGIAMATLENKAGEYVKPSNESAQATLSNAEFDDNLIAWMPDPAGQGDYPIVTFTWLLCYKKYDDKTKADALKNLVNYCVDEGQNVSEELGYIPLPADVREKVKAALKNIGA